MNTPSWTDANFYIISEDLHYTIRGEVELEEDIDGEILQRAADIAFRRYPYFSTRVILRYGQYVITPNPLPNPVYCGPEAPVLGSEAVNYHLFVISYDQNRIFFHVSHCITDGIGRAPFTKTLLYYYLTEKYGIELDPTGICLADTALYPDEFGEPFPLRKIMKAQPVFHYQIGDAYKLNEHHPIKGPDRREFRFRIDEKAFVSYCKSVGSTPAGLISVLFSQVLWELDEKADKSIVVAMCLNLRPALENAHSHLRLLANIPISYSPDMAGLETAALCAFTRKRIEEQKQPEHILYLCRKNIEDFEKVLKINNLNIRKKAIQTMIHAKEGFLTPTCMVSYMGRNSLGSLFPYVKAMYTAVDAIPDHGATIEITTAAGNMFFSFLQDFADDLYVNGLIRRLETCGIPVTKISAGPLMTPRMQLPE